MNGYTLDIDTRPSDALALAVRANVPILVSHEVMEVAGILPEEDLSEAEAAALLESSAESEVEIENIEERLSVFEDFLEGLDPQPGEDPEGDGENGEGGGKEE